MAQGTKGQVAATTAPTNGVTGGHAPAAAGVNRKKQKRREKQAARQAAEQDQKQNTNVPDYGDPEFGDHDQFDPADGDDLYYTDDEGQAYGHPYNTNGHYQTDYAGNRDSSSTSKKSKKKKKSRSAPPQPPYNGPTGNSANALPHSASQVPPPPPPPPPQLSSATLRTVQRGANSKDRIWNTSTSEERERIKEFWLSLGEDERKSLVKIEKEAVLRKMKEQQKHSCSCTVCGRKRTAIEEELEVLYDAYYEELEQYANHQQENGGPMLPPPSRYSHSLGSRVPPDRMPHMMNSHQPSRIRELADDESEDDDEEGEDEEYSEDDDEDDYSEEEHADLPRGPATDFFNFGNSLTVKGGILTVADDLLKNDGKKFIEMMEQLAERRMQREEEAQYAAAGLSHPNVYSKAHTAHSHGAPPDDDDYDEEEDEDYEEDDEDYEDEDEMDTMTEEQRMEEGRRMFQIFAARMFEQRVLTAYREKVAAERQAKLLEELEEESRLDVQREAKRAREAQKKKDKKEKQKQAKAEEKARKEAEKAAEEAAAKALEEKKQEEQRRKKEEQRKKKEAERKAQEEERQRKEAERVRRLQEERERQQEIERKIREQKAQEKKIREEAKRKEREEREAREKEAREKKAQEDKERREREAKARTEKERVRKDDQTAAGSQAPTSAVKRPSQPVAVALPPGLLSKQSSTGFPSPHVQVATPAIPKAPTPVRPRQSSQQGSHGSSPKTPQVAPGTSKSMSPSNTAPQMQNSIAPKTILTKPSNAQQQAMLHHPQPSSPMAPIGPPLGMQPPGSVMGGMPPGLNGFPHSQAPMMPGMMGPRPSIGHNMPMFPPQPGSQFRPFPPPGMPGPAPGVPIGRGFPMEGPPGFPPSIPGIGATNQMPGFGMGMPSHSRQQSASFDKPNIEPSIAAPPAQPIARPAPIQRPSSVKPHEGNLDSRQSKGVEVDELANHLGSKALLEDADDPLPEFQSPDAETRRASMQAGGMPRNARMGFGFPEGPGQPRVDSYAPFGGSSGTGSAWSTPSMPFAMSGAPGWGNSPTSGMFNNTFPMMGNQQYAAKSRPVLVRRVVCQACKALASKQSSPDGYYAVNDVFRHIEATRSGADPQIKPDEIIEICDILGDSSNGGGTLNFKEAAPGSGRYAIKFEESGGPTAALGEIGSPIPGHSLPAPSAFGARPFPSLGSVTSPNY